ncbi:MAG: PQQ-dependent sugar dehydrogenase [Flavobacteriales bacterium]|nr:PQQ-dependent sugar dehydrogenase [Flavobacteriales bacterium]
MKKLAFLAPWALSGAIAVAQSPVTVQLVPVATGLTRITDIVHAGDERIFCVLQAGSIRIVQPNGTVLPTPFLSIPVNSSGNEQGLLGMAFDPDYANNGFFYVYYTTGSGAGSSRVSRFSVSSDPNVADASSESIIYTLSQPYTNHNGGDLTFGPDGYLYIGFGDGGSAGDPQNYAQNMNSALGKMVRIDVNGGSPYAVPADNPFVGTAGVLPEIWASGLRNPWRFGFDALTGDLWIGDVGQNAWEEVDFWPAGDNSGPDFGWRCYEGLVTFNTNGCGPAADYVPPVQVHTTSSSQWCSIIGGRVYRGQEFARLYGRYIYTDYCLGRFHSLRPDGQGGWINDLLLTPGSFGISCIGENSALELYAGNSNNGTLYRIVDPCPNAAPIISQAENVLTSSEAQTYTWYLNGELIPNATGQEYEAVASGTYTVLAGFGSNCTVLSEPIYVSLVGVDEVNANPVRVHPVPANDVLNVDGLPASARVIRLVDTAGRTVLTQQVSRIDGPVQVDVSGLPAAQYLMLVDDDAGAVLVRMNVSVLR